MDGLAQREVPQQPAPRRVALGARAVGEVGGHHHARVRAAPAHDAAQVAELPPARERDAVEEAEDERQERGAVVEENLRVEEQVVRELAPDAHLERWAGEPPLSGSSPVRMASE